MKLQIFCLLYRLHVLMTVSSTAAASNYNSKQIQPKNSSVEPQPQNRTGMAMHSQAMNLIKPVVQNLILRAQKAQNSIAKGFSTWGFRELNSGPFAP